MGGEESYYSSYYSSNSYGDSSPKGSILDLSCPKHPKKGDFGDSFPSFPTSDGIQVRINLKPKSEYVALYN